jgi:hypothetical protein
LLPVFDGRAPGKPIAGGGNTGSSVPKWLKVEVFFDLTSRGVFTTC